jgi:oligopeptide transport system ATP-binding protein
MNDDVVLKVVNLKQHFKTGVGKYKIYNRAVDGVSFEVKKGEVFSLVGESGCGKTTTGRTLMKIYKPTDGEVFLLGKRIVAGTQGLERELKGLPRNLKKDILKIKEDQTISNETKVEKINELKLQMKIRKEEVKLEIKQRKIDQNQKYRPAKEEVNQVRIEAEKRVVEIKDLIKKANEEFLAFKSSAFIETDSLPKNTPAEEKHRVHNIELTEYRRKRLEKNQLVEQYNHEIIHNMTLPKFYNRPLSNEMQMVFQDPIDSLNPRMNVKDIIAESLYINKIKNEKIIIDKVLEVLKLVGLHPNHIDHYPHEFSGGQRQRIGIARAIISEPKIIIADEPISALDVSIQAQVINLLNELRKELNLTIIFIAHDLSVVKFLSDKVAIMYFGKIVEMGSKEKVFNNPLHPYTHSLISSIPMPDPNYERERGKNSKYDPRQHDYQTDLPSLREIETDHFVYANDKEFAEYQKIIRKNK